MNINIRVTNQYQHIYTYLQGVDIHPTAEDVYKAVKRSLPRITRATVYRNLNKMVKNGDCIKCKHKKITHYDPNTTTHHHFVCLKCHTLYDIDRHSITLTKSHLPHDIIDNVTRLEAFIYGYCKNCIMKGANI